MVAPLGVSSKDSDAFCMRQIRARKPPLDCGPTDLGFFWTWTPGRSCWASQETVCPGLLSLLINPKEWGRVRSQGTPQAHAHSEALSPLHPLPPCQQACCPHQGAHSCSVWGMHLVPNCRGWEPHTGEVAKFPSVSLKTTLERLRVS